MEKMRATSKHLIREAVQKKIVHSGKAISNTPNLEVIEVGREAYLVEKFGISKKWSGKGALTREENYLDSIWERKRREGSSLNKKKSHLQKIEQLLRSSLIRAVVIMKCFSFQE